jgi:hypothetical protein
MKIEAAHIDQLARARNGRMILISHDVGGVAAQLREIDPGLRVRFAEAGDPPYWVVYHEQENADGSITHTLVLTAQAHQTNTGVWTGLDQRVVDRVREIDAHGRSGYDFAAEVEKQNRQAHENRRAEFRRKVEPITEQAAHAVRKDLGSTAKAFIPRDVPRSA